MKKLLTLVMCTVLVFNCFILNACNKEIESVQNESFEADSTEASTVAEIEKETAYTPPELPQIIIQKATNDPKAMPGAPIYYGSSYSISKPESYSSYTDVGITVRVKYIDAASDAYMFYDDWYQTKYNLVKFRTVEAIYCGTMADEFYFAVPSDYMVDFSEYDSFVLLNIGQLAYEYSVLYNVDKQTPERITTPIFGYDNIFLSRFLDSEMMAFDSEGKLDKRLWTSNEAWTKSSGSDSKNFSDDYSIADVIAKTSEYDEDYKNYFFCHNLVTEDEECLALIDEIKTSENFGLIPTNSVTILSDENVSLFVQRYINGFITRENIEIYGEIIERSDVIYTEEDIKSAPDLAPAITSVAREFYAGNIIAPHFYDKGGDATLFNHGIFAWYEKTSEGIIGVVRINWCFYETGKNYYDDAYYIVKNGSDTCQPISNKDLLAMLGEEEHPYIYNDDYDTNGKLNPYR